MRAKLLKARERRQAALSSQLIESGAATIFFSLNIPGVEKTPRGADAFFSAMLVRLLDAFAPAHCAQGRDALGPYAILSVATEPIETKRRCLALEASEPCARLADLDVYAAGGGQVDRGSLGLPGRSCLVCAQAAVECIRVKRHDAQEVIAKVHELLSPYRS